MSQNNKSNFYKQKKNQNYSLNTFNNQQKNKMNKGILKNNSQNNNVQLEHSTTIFMNQNQKLGKKKSEMKKIKEEEEEEVEDEIKEIKELNENSNLSNTEERQSIEFESVSESKSSEGIDIEEEYLDLKGTIKNAKIHAKAKKILKTPKQYSPDNPVVFCNDCLLPQETKGIVEPFPYCIDPKELHTCGNGIYLFFVFHWYLIINLIGLIIICSIPYMIIAKKYADNLYKYCSEFYIDNDEITGFETNNSNCKYFINSENNNVDDEEKYNTFDWINKYSGETMLRYIKVLKDISNKENIDDIVVNFNFISFITLLYLFIINLLFVSLSSVFIADIDSSIITPNSYSVMVSDIPIKYGDKDLKKYLTYDNSIEIHDINLTYQLTELEKLKDKYRKIEQISFEGNEFTEYYENGFLCWKKKIKLESLHEEKKQIIEKIKLLNNDISSKSFTGVVFLIFNYESDAKKYVKVFPKTFFGKCFKNSSRACLAYLCCCISKKEKKKLKKKIKLTGYLAPEPEDIIFEHLEFNFLQRLLRTSILFFFSILLTGISLVLVLLLNKVQFDNEKKVKNKFFLKYGLSLVITIVTSIINLLIKLLFQKFGDYEKPWTYTDKYLFTSIKLTLLSFVNSALVPLISNVLKNGRDDHQMLLNNMFVIFICGSIISPLLSLSCYDLLINKIKLWFFITRKYKSDVTSIPLSQKQLNYYFESPNMNISYQYSFLSKSILMTFFYMPIFPLGPVITLIGVILNYFIEKFKMLNIYKRPEKLNEQITYFYIDYFVMGFIAWSIGNYIFFGKTHSNHFYELFNLIFYAVIIFVPYNYFIRKFDISNSKANKNNVSYENAFLDFVADYERLNPKTQLQGAYKYIDRLVKKEWLTEEMGEKAKEKITSTNIKTLYYFIRQTYNIENNIVRKNCRQFEINKNDIPSERNEIAGVTKDEEDFKAQYTRVSMFLNNVGLVALNKREISILDSNVLFNNDNMNNINPLFSSTYSKLSQTKYERANTLGTNSLNSNIINNNNNNMNKLSKFNTHNNNGENANSKNNLNIINDVYIEKKSKL